MTRYAFAIDPPVLFPTFPPFVGPDGETYPMNFLQLAKPKDLADRKIKPVVENPAPAGKRIASETIVLIGGKPTAQSVFEDLPPPERRLIKKSVIHERVNNVGKLEAALAVLQSNAILYARWFAPDWPEVYFDDPDMLTLLAFIGCTPEQIAQITA